jgi:hypothetical protein
MIAPLSLLLSACDIVRRQFKKEYIYIRYILILYTFTEGSQNCYSIMIGHCSIRQTGWIRRLIRMSIVNVDTSGRRGSIPFMSLLYCEAPEGFKFCITGTLKVFSYARVCMKEGISHVLYHCAMYIHLALAVQSVSQRGLEQIYCIM